MTSPDQFDPGPATGAEIDTSSEKWTLVMVRELRHPPLTVWKALTDPELLRAWAPFDADRDIGMVGTVQLTTVGAPAPMTSQSRVKRAEAPRLLEYDWGGQDIRWQLEPSDAGTRLTLWHNINRNFIAMGAAGWHICIDVMDRLIAGRPVGRMVGPDAMQFGGWQRLHVEYGKLLGVEITNCAPRTKA